MDASMRKKKKDAHYKLKKSKSRKIHNFKYLRMENVTPKAEVAFNSLLQKQSKVVRNRNLFYSKLNPLHVHFR